MNAQHTIIHELEQALAHGTTERRVETLQSITDLFVLGSGRYAPDQVALFDDVFGRLVAEIEMSARAVLARRLAPITTAPANIIRMLAFDDAIDVAGPVLTHSERLDDALLVENASTKGQQHLLAISRRKLLSENVTDILVQRGNDEVVHSTAQNAGAKFSELGFEHLVMRSEDNERLAMCVGSRRDIPRHQFVKLLSRASQAARAKLEALHPGKIEQVQHVVGEIAGHIQKTADVHPRDYAAARAVVQQLFVSGQLHERDVVGFAKSGQFEETTAALSLLCNLPIEVVERAMAQDSAEAVLILAKAAALTSDSARAILQLRAGQHRLSPEELERNLANFAKLKSATAQYVVRYQRMRANAGVFSV